MVNRPNSATNSGQRARRTAGVRSIRVGVPRDETAHVCDHTGMHPPIIVPDIRTAVRHALPNVVEGKVVPVLLFVGFLEMLGTRWALLVALTWSLTTIGYRTITGRRVPGLIVLSTATLIAKTIVALVTGSMVAYFLQPTLTTILVGAVFLVSIPFGRPLAQRIACDVLPFDDDTKAHPQMRQFFVRLSLLWSLTSMLNATVTIWLLFTQSTTTFVLVKAVLGPMTGVLTVGTVFLWFRWKLARTGTQVIWAPRHAPALA
jgi:hypothetical protein